MSRAVVAFMAAGYAKAVAEQQVHDLTCPDCGKRLPTTDEDRAQMAERAKAHVQMLGAVQEDAYNGRLLA